MTRNSATEIPTASSHRRSAALVIIAAWALTTVFAFWFYSLRQISTLSDHWVTFTGMEIKLNQKMPKTTIIHWVDPECSCTRFSLPHIEKLKQEYSAADHYIYSAADTQQTLPDFVEKLKATPPASPSVMIFSEGGELAYYGPYTSGLVCGSGKDLLEPIMQQLSRGNNPGWVNQEAVGCFCPWPIFKERDEAST